MTEESKPIEPLHVVAAREVAPVNQAALLSATLAGAVATVAVDIGAPRSIPGLAILCVIGWLMAMGLTVMLIGRGQPRDPKAAGTLRRYVLDGWYRCITRKRYGLVLALMAGLAAYAVFVKLREPEGGVLANVFHVLKDVQSTSKATGADVTAIRGAMETPEMLSSRGGYPPTPFGAAEAVAKADLKGLRLVQTAGVKTVATTDNPVGRLIELKDANVGEVLDAAGLEGPVLDIPFPLRQVNGKSTVPDFGQLLSSVGIRVVPDDDPMKVVEVIYVKSTNLSWAEQRVQVPPIVKAVWLNKPEAVKALLMRNAATNAAAVFTLRVVERRRNTNKGEAARAYPYVLGSRDAVLKVSALSEARRLGLRDIEAILVANKASAEVALK